MNLCVCHHGREGCREHDSRNCFYAHGEEELMGWRAPSDASADEEEDLIPWGSYWPYTLGKAPLCPYYWDHLELGGSRARGDECPYWHSWRHHVTRWMEYTTGRLAPEAGACCHIPTALDVIRDYFTDIPGTRRCLFDFLTAYEGELCASHVLWINHSDD